MCASPRNPGRELFFFDRPISKTGAMSWTLGRRSGGGASQLEPVGADENVNANLGDVALARVDVVGTCMASMTCTIHPS